VSGRYILVGQTPVEESDLLTWGRWLETTDTRVRRTRVGPYEVSTVFLGLDHQFSPGGPPLLFETMVLVPELKHAIKLGRLEQEVPDFLEIQERCSTWLEAEAQHERVVEEVRGEGDEVVQLYPLPLLAEVVG
jgi:hypothetical protein